MGKTPIHEETTELLNFIIEDTSQTYIVSFT